MAKATFRQMRWVFFGRSGRLSRKVFALALVFWILVSLTLLSAAGSMPEDDDHLFLLGLAILIALPMCLYSLALLALRRLHDAGLPGLLMVLLVVPPVAFIIFLLMISLPSVKGPSKHGPGPDLPGY